MVVSGAGSERIALTEERMAARYLVDRAWRSPEATGFNLEYDWLGDIYARLRVLMEPLQENVCSPMAH